MHIHQTQKLLAILAFVGTVGISSSAFAQYGASPERSTVLQGHPQTQPGAIQPSYAPPTSTQPSSTLPSSVQPSVTQYNNTTTNDANLTAKVQAALTSDAKLKPPVINVIINNGAVELIGTVNTRDQKNEAVNAVTRIEGVKSVRDNLVISQINDMTRTSSSQALPPLE